MCRNFMLILVLLNIHFSAEHRDGAQVPTEVKVVSVVVLERQRWHSGVETVSSGVSIH